MNRTCRLSILISTFVCLGLVAGCGPKPGTVLDEAKRAGLSAGDLPGSADDYLKDMDRGLTKYDVHQTLKALKFDVSPDEAWDYYNRGRNNWVVWTGGNDRLWDFLGNNTFGTFDLLKTLSSYTDLRDDKSKEKTGNRTIRYCGNTEARYGYDTDGATYQKATAYGGSDYYGKDRPAPYPPGYLAYDHSGDDCQGPDRKFFDVSRDNRWKYLGLVNEPCMKKWEPPADCNPKKDKWGCGNPDRFGLWVDTWDASQPGCPLVDPFEDADKYPGVKIGARGRKSKRAPDGKLPVGSYYGYASGIVGLRLFPNPDFDKKAERRWGNGRKYYEKPDFYKQKKLVRPYRVGMSCGFCHVGPSPINPPKDYENPKWENLTSNPGAQYFWIDRIFVWEPDGRQENFIYQLLHTSLPGSLDTSLVSSDNINNPRTMNAVYSIGARLGMVHAEKLTGGELNNKQFNDYERTHPLSEYFVSPDTVLTPHVLKDGADSVGILGALNRVYLNIGLASEEWLLHFRPLIGSLPFKRISPIEISVLEKNSTYWNANVEQTPDVALFFAVSAQPDKLKDVKDVAGGRYLDKHPEVFDDTKVPQGKIVFAENCARCHSGKQPPKWEEGKPHKGTLCELGTQCAEGQILPNSAEYFKWMREAVVKSDFLDNNFLSSEVRIPVTDLGTNACSPLGTNGIGGDIWDNFTSTTYKELPSVGSYTVHHPITGDPYEYPMPADGRGYTRPASLISLWSTAPFLLNNAVGQFYGAGTTEARLASFEDSIQKMLWPEKREYDKILGDTLPGYIQRTTANSYLVLPKGYLPPILRLIPRGELKIGPIPCDTPVGLLANLPFVADSDRKSDRVKHFKKVLRFAKKAAKDLKELPAAEDVGEAGLCRQAKETFANLVEPLLELSKCPDFVVNRGHYFGTNLDDDDKKALIEFLKTL